MAVDVLLFTGMGNNIWQRSIGAYRIATELRKHNYTVQVVDKFPAMIQENHDMYKQIINRFVGPNTLWVGFSSTFFVNRRTDAYTKTWRSGAEQSKDLTRNTTGLPTNQEFLDDIRQTILDRNPKCKLVLGGGKAAFREAEIIDIYVEGYADTSVIKMTRWIEGKNPFFQVSRNADGKSVSVIDDPKAINFDFVNSSTIWHESDHIFPGEGLPIEISRGCIFKCKFCAYPLNGKHKMDYIRDTSCLRDEFTRNYELFGTTSYLYADDTHNDSMEKLEILYDQVYSKLNFKINFVTYLRLDLIAAKPESAKLLLESGLYGTTFGIETLNEKSTKSIGKGITTQRAIETLHYLKDLWGDRVVTAGSFIVGLPHDTEETVNEWTNLIMNPEFPLDIMFVQPLAIYKNGGRYTWKSDIDINSDKYGYHFPDDSRALYWENSSTGLNFDRATELANHANTTCRKNRKNMNEIWGIPGLLTMGYTYNQIRTGENVSYEDFLSRSNRMTDEYFNKLLGKQ